MTQTIAPYGTWKSPLTAKRATAGSLRFDHLVLDGDDLYWLEGRASEGGRNVIVRRRPDGSIADVTPEGFNVRSRVHEYGGAAYTVHEGTIYFSNFADQRLYRQVGLSAPEPLTAEGYFYAECRVDAARNRLLGVREDHTQTGTEPQNTIVAIPIPDRAGGSNQPPLKLRRSADQPPPRLRRSAGALAKAEASAKAEDPPLPVNTEAPVLAVDHVLVEGSDFYSDPILSPDGTQLAWLQWNHPNMPWDGTELWVAEVDAAGALGSREKVAGASDESIFQPEWSPDGRLYFVSDRTGWWNLYRAGGSGGAGRSDQIEALHPMAAEFGKPQWTLSMTTYTFVSGSRLIVTYSEGGRWKMALLETEPRRFEPLDVRLEPLDSIRATPRDVFFIGGSAIEPTAIARMAFPGPGCEVLRASTDDRIAQAWVSPATPIAFMSGEHEVYAFYYAPKNPDFIAPESDRPPLLVLSHGGPTGATSDALDNEVQFWTSRGFAVLDVNYGGSTGYGREYRDRLKGQWGIVDVADSVNGAKHLVADGKADRARLIIRGGSAGGYTTLAALTFHDTFKAGASYYGISDIEVLARDTHKFESRYLDSLIGPYPAARDLYRQRSPIHHTDRLSCALILFQGLEDKVVPPNQSEMMAAAVRAKGLPVAYVPFAGEQHGFRKAENISRSFEAELYFYGAVFGFAPADVIEPVAIDNLR